MGPNPNRIPGPVPPPSTTVFAENGRTLFTHEVSLGVQREIWGQISVTADYVRARGENLLVARDLNYPDLNDPLRRRPTPNFQQITAIQTAGHS